MLQDIEPHIFDNAFDQRRAAKEGDHILCYSKDEVWMKESEKTPSGFEFPRFEELFAEAEAEELEKLYYLFSIDETAYYLLGEDSLNSRLDLLEERGAVLGGGFQPVQIFRTMGEGDTVPLAMMTGFHLYNWLRKNRFCGRCGHEMKPHSTERALACPECRNLLFPTIAPAVAVAVVNGDKLLLARSTGGNYRRFSLIAGFVEIGESIEQTVHREVLEEVGLRVKNLKYVGSQPWGLTGIEMLGFFVELDGPDHITIQESELAEAGWFTAEEIDWDMAMHSLSYTMIDEFRRSHRKGGK